MSMASANMLPARLGRGNDGSSTKPRWCAPRQGSEGQPALCGHQPKTESAVDLREDLLSAGRRGKPHQGATRRNADRTDQLLELFGEHVPRAADSGGVCADAGDATALVPEPTRPRASLDLARALSKTRGSSHRHSSSHRAALASSVSLPR